jgi:type II secretory ATPase GspE/PulE/Tfp pilus assembly ATPase PilB-like protein
LSVRLIRINCTYCLQSYQPEPAALRLLPEETAATAQFKRGAGCKECHETGFAGRSAVTVLLVPNETFRDAVMQKLPARALQQVAIEQGMRTLWHNGLRRVLAGQTTIEEIMRVIAVDQL